MNQASLSLQVDIISNYDDFLELKNDWDDAYCADPESQFFLSWSWLQQVFSHYKSGWFIVAVRHADALNKHVAFLPLQMNTRMSNSSQTLIHEIRVAGRYTWSDYAGIICQPSYQQQAIVLIACALKKLHWRNLYLKNLTISRQLLDLFTHEFEPDLFNQKYLKQTGRTDKVNRLVCPCIELPDSFDAYLAENTSANTRQKIRRFLRKIEHSESLRIVHSTTDNAQSNLDILINLWKKKWSKHKGEETERIAKKYRQILEFGLKNESLLIPVLWDGDKPLGVLGILMDRQKQELLYFIAGRDEHCNNPPPGLVLHAHTIKWAITNGFKSYDFLRGDEQFKYSLGGVDKHISYLVISRRSGNNHGKTLDPAYLYQAIEKAREYKDKGQNKKAMHCFQQILDLQPDNLPAHYYLGRTFYNQNMMDKAALSFGAALNIDAGESETTKKTQQKARYYLHKLKTKFALDNA